jgi:hypothetical protein
MNNIPPWDMGPIAAERNPPINPEYYQPSRFVIEAISYGPTTLVTTTLPNNYAKGQLVRLMIPSYWGARQLNNRQGYVITIPDDNQVVVAIDSRGYTAFGFVGADTANKKQQPQIIAMGDINSGAINAAGRVMNGTFIPGSFIDVSA